MKFQRGICGIALLFLFHRRYIGWSTPRPGHFTLGTDPVPTAEEAGWVGLDRYGKPGPPLGFDPQTVQPVVNRYTD